MASNTQKTKKIRARKARANKTNIKTNQKRLHRNLEVVAKVSASQQ
jgi:hypothetical protein